MRLGFSCAKQIEKAVQSLDFRSSMSLGSDHELLQLEPREFPEVELAKGHLKKQLATYTSLKKNKADKAQVRTAECAVFGAEETLTLAKAAEGGLLEKSIHACLPAEISLFRLGDWSILSWPGEFFVEYALALKEIYPQLAIISMANGELQGYIVTEEAVQANTYEASNALFSHENGPKVLAVSKALIERSNIFRGEAHHVG